jgi:hypothetical protein
MATIDRRRFLQAASVTALSAPWPFMASRPAVAGAVSVAATPAAVFNGGRSQVNLNFLQSGGAYPFLNCLKTAQAWSFIDNSGYPDPTTLDNDGYPVRITNGGVYTVFFVPSQATRPGNYVITWSGNGTIYCGMSNTPVSGSKTSTNGGGRYVFSTKDTRFVVGISAIGTPRISNLKVFHAADEAALNAGQVFGQMFKARLLEANFGVVRFLNWQSGNTSNVTTWSTRKPVSYVFYSGYEFRPGLYAGTTTNVGNAYSASLSGFRLVDKATVIVRFNASGKGPCTLDINGSGAIKILSAYTAELSSDTYPIGGTWQSLATLVYDATLNAWIKRGGDTSGSVGLDNGCPPELMVQLCAEIGAHPHFVTPMFAIDPATDYMPSLAAYCRTNAPAWMIPRFEGPNELWNFAYGFMQTGYASAKASAYGWGPDYHNWYGKALSVLGQIVAVAYGLDRTRYQVLCGVQTATGTSAGGTASSNARLLSTKYVSQSAPAQAPYNKTPAANWVTHICTAQYITPSEYGTPQEATDAAAYAAATTPAAQSAIANAYANTVTGGSGSFTLPKVAALYTNWKAWALSHGIKKMCGYEGGYSPDYTGVATLDRLRAASKLTPELAVVTLRNYEAFVSLSDSGFTAEFPSCFQLSGSAPSSSAWSVLEDIYQTPEPPQWSAIVTFNHTATATKG